MGRIARIQLPWRQPRELELQHFIHEHPLIGDEFPGNFFSSRDGSKRIVLGEQNCAGCGEEIKGSCFCCGKCPFHLHNSCAKLPHELHLPIHDKHPLVLQETTQRDKHTYKCNYCNLFCKYFFYSCPLCEFVLDVKCASSLQSILEVEIHDHQLVLVQGSKSFTCDFCGKKGEGMSCLCALCGIWFHHKCAFLPYMVKHMRHKHPLKLTKSLKTDQSKHQLCQFCVKKLDKNYGSYYCSSCDYVAHLGCAMDEEGRELSFNPIKSTTPVGKDKIIIPIVVKHFSHEHVLKLTNELENYEICDGCIRPIFSPFYKCAQCSFFLHNSCVELPDKMQHPLHKHMLTLQSKRHMLALCDACKLLTNGFTYQCRECGFELDVSCSLIPEKLTHVGHKHSLILSSATSDENCSACNYIMKIFRCTKGEFTLDFGCATLPLTVKHRQHEHLFTLQYTAEDNSSEYYCDICEEERDSKFWFYYCDECSFPAHPKCIFGEFLNSKYRDCRNIKFGSTYTSDIHQHPLTLARKTMDHDSCDKCGKFCNEVAYECATCNSIIQVEGLPNCKTSLMDFAVNLKVQAELARKSERAEFERRRQMAELDTFLPLRRREITFPRRRPRKLKLQHFIHEHPLIGDEFPGNFFSSRDGYKRIVLVVQNCDGCGEEIKGSCFCCGECPFHLHNSCAELPHELHLPIHDEHPLVLRKTTQRDKHTCKCNYCNLFCKYFFYGCPFCEFVLDVKCASSLQSILEVEIHDHQLVLVQGSKSFTCDFCGKKGEGMSCLCALCGIWFHHKCAFLPYMVKHMRHKHPLQLTKSLETDQSEHQLCQFCVKKLDKNYGSYYCSSCDYVAHLDCAMYEEGMELSFMRIKSITPVGKDKIKIPIEVKHFSHEHVLKLTNELENYEICDGCIRPIISPFYKCAQCFFFLHNSCVELPDKMQHPLHKHMLTLTSKRHMLALCDACKLLTNGFTYQCRECGFELDVSCSLIPEKLTHVGHEHSLTLSSTTSDENCSACNYIMKIFRCTKGEFTLDFGCATLPLTVKHRQHKHLFTLQYTAEDNSGEYYCDICEEERDSKFWFYYCDECSFPAHPKCIFGEFLNSKYRDCRNIKFGSTYTSDIHQHPLTLAHKTMDHDSCDKCGKFCNEVAYECATCNSIIQVENLPNCKISLMDFAVNLKMAELERRRNEMAEMAELERRRNEMAEMAELERRRNEMAELMRRRNEMTKLVREHQLRSRLKKIHHTRM